MIRIRTTFLVCASTAALLAACTTPEPASPNVPSYQSQVYSQPNGAPVYGTRRGTVEPARYANTGIVNSIELVRGEPSRGLSPGGAIIGAVVGGLVGNQIGAGTGKAVATVAGVAGGAVAGNAIGNRVGAAPDMYRVGIAYDNGGTQFIDVPDPGDLRIGERVSVNGGQISRY